MINFDYFTNWLKIHDHPYEILIIGSSGSGKRNASFSSISREIDIDKIYFYAKDANEAKYQLSINKPENSGLKQSNDSKAFIEYSNDMDDIYKIELLIRIYRFHTKSSL